MAKDLPVLAAPLPNSINTTETRDSPVYLIKAHVADNLLLPLTLYALPCILASIYQLYVISIKISFWS